MFQEPIWWNKIENDAMKMHLFEKFKIDALGTSQGRYPKDGFSGCFEDVRRTFLQNYKNKQRLAFKVFHATHLVTRIENDAAVKCFVLRLKLTSWGHADTTSECN